ARFAVLERVGQHGFASGSLMGEMRRPVVMRHEGASGASAACCSLVRPKCFPRLTAIEGAAFLQNLKPMLQQLHRGFKKIG
ncbi:MAG: hypothetical protein FWF31_09170, partial [Desulfobulbus sp.]|nr:hypothetical protein [Desulfobulbus sp.]